MSSLLVPAATIDPDLVNPWGLTASPTGKNTEWWVSDNGTGMDAATLARLRAQRRPQRTADHE